MSRADRTAGEISLPVKRTDGDTLEERLTANAYENILPARYLRKDADGELVESQEELFERVARNVALAEVVFEAEQRDIEITVTPDQLKPDHPRRDELAATVFGKGVTADDAAETVLTQYNVNKFAYTTVVPELPEGVRNHVEGIAHSFRDSMEKLSFVPNSPTLMNAGDELQQLSACFVDSPADDMDDIYDTLRESAKVMQCLTEDSTVVTKDRGIISVRSVERGDEIATRDGYRVVEETHEYRPRETVSVDSEIGVRLRGTTDHRILVDGEWTRFDEISVGDTVTVKTGWLLERGETTVELETVSKGPQWGTDGETTNERIRELHAQGLSDYEIASRIAISPSTVQRRRSNELELPSNNPTGRKTGSVSFDTDEFERLYGDGLSDSEIAAEIGLSKPAVQAYRTSRGLERNGVASVDVEQPDELTPDLAEIVGMWIGDGSYHQDGIRLHNRRDAIIERFAAVVENRFGIGVSVIEDDVAEVGVYSAELKRWWKANFGDGKTTSLDATVPKKILESGPECIGGFLRGLISTDGTLARGTYPRLYTASDDLAEATQQLFLGLGIPVTRSFGKRTTNYSDGAERPYNHLRVVAPDGLNPFLERVGFAGDRGEEMEKALAQTGRGKAGTGNVVDEKTWEVEVVSVEREPGETVYDVTMEGDPEYYANSVVSHNSGGGMGYAFWNLRPYGDTVGSSGGIASGPITFMRSYDSMCETIAQGGTRRGAQMGVMRVSHPDIIQFIHAKNKDVSLAHSLRLNDPDDFTHTRFIDALEEARELIDEEGRVPKHLRNAVEGHLSNFNISVGVTDGFMDALYADEAFTFTNPRTEEPHIATEETKELYECYGLGKYVEVGEELSIPAAELWDHIVEGAYQNGEPGVIYLERVNKEHSFDIEKHPDHEILATNPCVTGETLVRVADGREVAIADLAETGGSVDVLCRDAETGETVVRAARQPRLTRENADVIRVQTESGFSLVCTPDHDIWTPDGYVSAGELNAGDTIVGTSGADEGALLAEEFTVAFTEDTGTADVYNITVDDHHNYLCRTEGDDGYISIANCGEQPLEEYEACNLGHINLSTLAATDAPDWRVWSDAHESEYDSHEAAMAAYLDEAIDFEAFDRRIELGTRFLENVVTMSDFPVAKIEQKVREMRKIGLGIMGLAQLYIQLGVRYGSDEGNEIARQLMTHINHESKHVSHELAGVRGNFEDWEDSKYANPTEYREWFETQTGESADDWEDGFPVRNHNTTTIAPTGTTSMVGNTTGGCEPIYNVAYYKNVSDDVQGDEMLVEFDDYFLRVLEANDIDVEAVKEEAQDQMSSNKFDGVEGLETVPNAIGELFVVTSDLSGKQHAAVQCACQAGVDSAISKTCNFSNSATKEDMDEVYRYIYDNGGKGVTVYRDGTRSKQVLTTRADNAEFADEGDAATVIAEQIAEVFGGIEGFLDSEDVRAALDADLASVVSEPVYAEKQPRPDVLHGVTQRVDTGYGKLYVNINEDEQGRPFELFANIGHSGGFTNSFTEALAKVISTALRSGVDPEEIVDELNGTRSPKVAWDKGEQIQSIPDAIGTAMRRYLDGEIEKTYPQQRNLAEIAEEDETEEETEPDGGAAQPTTDHQQFIDNGENPECPSCGALALYYSEGCKTCESCGWSEC